MGKRDFQRELDEVIKEVGSGTDELDRALAGVGLEADQFWSLAERVREEPASTDRRPATSNSTTRPFGLRV